MHEVHATIITVAYTVSLCLPSDVHICDSVDALVYLAPLMPQGRGLAGSLQVRDGEEGALTILRNHRRHKKHQGHSTGVTALGRACH